MRIAVVSCWKYRDTWKPFFELFKEFWPDCPYEVDLVSDLDWYGKYYGERAIEELKKLPANTRFVGLWPFSGNWCQILSRYATERSDQPILLMQDDFFLNAPVNELLIVKGLQQLEQRNAAMVRLYPCPGGDIPYGDKWYAEIPKGAPYRVSCQASIWRPDVLHKIAFTCDTPADFEIRGSKVSNEFDEPFLAFRRDVQPWPLSYYCSAISRGKWEPAALEFCRQQGIEVDTTMREVA